MSGTLILHTAPVEQVARATELARARGWALVAVYTGQPERFPRPPAGGGPAAVPELVASRAPFGSSEETDRLRARGWERVILLYNHALGCGYCRWREFAAGLAPEVWTLTPDGVLAPLTAFRRAAEDRREVTETLGRSWCRILTPILAAVAWGFWNVLGRGGRRPGFSAVRALVRETRGVAPVSRLVRMLHLLAALEATGAREVVDIGTGDGLLLKLLAAGGWSRLLGADRAFSPALKRRAEASAGAITLTETDLETWSPPSGSPCLVACEVLEHLADDRGAVRRWAAALAPGGTLVIHVPFRDEPIFPGDATQADHCRPGYTPDELRGLLEAGGLAVQDLRWTFGPAAARLGWLDRRLAHRPLLQHLARPALIALALADLFETHRAGHGLLVTAHRARVDSPGPGR